MRTILPGLSSAPATEGGVWVIAETADTPTKFRKIVVTDEQGRFLFPDLPTKATYTYLVVATGWSIGARSSDGGSDLALEAAVAPNARTAARCIRRTTGIRSSTFLRNLIFRERADGKRHRAEMRTQHHWISQIKVNCNVCHQLGNQATREIPKALGTFATSVDAWDRRLQAGQDGESMSRP